MNISQEVMETVKGRCKANEAFAAILRECYGRKADTCPETRATAFDDWLGFVIDHVAGMITDTSPDAVYDALHFQTAGDANTVSFAVDVAGDGFETDTNTYVEDGTVYTALWIKGGDHGETMKESNKFAARFRALGYAVEEPWVDPDDDADITVNAYLDFDKARRVQ